MEKPLKIIIDLNNKGDITRTEKIYTSGSIISYGIRYTGKLNAICNIKVL